MSFQISALPAVRFAALFALSDGELATRHIVRRVADAAIGFPCRVSLADADVGDSLLLLHYEHLPVASPYRSGHAIYVREHVRTAQPASDAVPDVLRRRLLSVRSFDAAGMMRGFEVQEGTTVAPVFARLLDDPEVDFLHIHYAGPGCYAARVDRAA